MVALAYGLPSVVIPIGADQASNAARCVELGVAEVLSGLELSAESIRAVVVRGLDDRPLSSK
jgi:UDP:flavonoid glycosyltransferase YjiC (YdhE family)